MIILGIETSCDETAAAVIEGSGDGIKVLSNVVASQIEIHKKYGGVVPEVAAREHVLNILPVVNEAIKRAENEIDAIAVTVGPGLITSLQVGVETAKTLAFAWRKPVVAVNHIEAHICSAFIDNPKIEFPALILTVSGGHTILVLMRGHGKLEVLGETRDDAAGEAFDKAASLLGLGYPGGPAISAAAEKIRNPKSEIPARNASHSVAGGRNPKQIQNSKFKIVLPRPMLESGDLDFSFSGLKTALLYQLQKDKAWKKRVSEYANEFQQAVVETLVGKTVRAARKFGVSSVILAGGVSANKELRERMSEAVKKVEGVKFYLPDLKYTTDNAVMIAAAGYFLARSKKFTPLNPNQRSGRKAHLTGFTPWQKLKTDPNLSL